MENKFPCSQCGQDATFGFSGFKDLKTKKFLIKKKERLCLTCARKRGVEWGGNKRRKEVKP